MGHFPCQSRNSTATVAVSLTINTVLLPAMYLMASTVQNVGRSLETAEANAKYHLHIITVCVINAFLSIWVMQFIV
ncbi:TPA: hypothetical protein H7V92_000923 [Escherichia coli]|nr:hypothetical protein [Escherichia coli]